MALLVQSGEGEGFKRSNSSTEDGRKGYFDMLSSSVVLNGVNTRREFP